MKNIILIILVILGTSFNLLFATEAFLPGDVASFKNTHKVIYSEHLNRNGQLYICNEDNFNNLFPKKPLNETGDGSVFVGQILDESGNGIGSGTLFDIEEKDNIIVGTGFTALHIFCSLNSTNGLSINSNYSFVIGRKATQVNSVKSNSPGHIDINHVLIQKDVPKDICLFKGPIAYKTDIFNSSQDFIDFFNRHKPNLIPKDIIVFFQDVKMYHHPAGKKDLRINTGQLQDEKTHTIRTLGGSSGAAIFYLPDFVVGIHIGQKENVADTTKIVRYFPSLQDSWLWFWLPESWRSDYQDFTVIKRPENKFERFSKKDYNDFLLQNIDLYNLSLSQRNDLHIALIKKI